MKFLAAAALMGAALAAPGTKSPGPRKDHSGIFKAIIERAGERLIEERQAPPVQPVILIGNLQAAGNNGTATNERIMGCFNSPNGATCTSTESYTPPTRDTPQCVADTCCIWSYIKDDLVPLMKNADGTCNDFARNAVRLGFHDAGAWDRTQTHGGADGSLLLDDAEVNRPANFGLGLSKSVLTPIFEAYRSYGISAADLVQFAHNVAVVVCPLGPRSLTYVGRPDWTPASQPNPDGLLPDANDSADNLLNLFAAKTIGTVDLVALLGAHTSAKQFFFDPSQSGMPLDTTPGVWDVAFYSEVLSGTTPCGVFRLPSDNNLGNHTLARNGFINMSRGFPGDTAAGQVLWNGLYSKAYLRLSLLGVQNIQGLTDCSKVLPNEVTTFQKPPSAIVSCPASSAIQSASSSAASSAVPSSIVASSIAPVSSSSVIVSVSSSSSSVIVPVSSSSVIVPVSSSSVSDVSIRASTSSSVVVASSSVRASDPAISSAPASSAPIVSSRAWSGAVISSGSGVVAPSVSSRATSSGPAVSSSSRSADLVISSRASSQAVISSSSRRADSVVSSRAASSGPAIPVSSSSLNSGVQPSSRASNPALSSVSSSSRPVNSVSASDFSARASSVPVNPSSVPQLPSVAPSSRPAASASSRAIVDSVRSSSSSVSRAEVPSSSQPTRAPSGSALGSGPTSSRFGSVSPPPVTSSRPGNNGPSSMTTTYSVTRTTVIIGQWGRKITSTIVEPITTVVPIDVYKTTTLSVTRTTTIVGQWGRKTTSTIVDPVTTVVKVDPSAPTKDAEPSNPNPWEDDDGDDEDEKDDYDACAAKLKYIPIILRPLLAKLLGC